MRWNVYTLNRLCVSFITLILVGCLITSCASFYDFWVKQPPSYNSPAIVDKTFEISGRFIVKTPEKNSYGNFNWIRTQNSETLSFTTPLGQTIATLNVESGNAKLTTKGHVYTGDDLNDLLNQRLGFTIPINYVHYWIQGISVPNIPLSRTLSDGFIQSGWQIEYLAWQDANHPRLIACTNVQQQLIIKLLIKW